MDAEDAWVEMEIGVQDAGTQIHKIAITDAEDVLSWDQMTAICWRKRWLYIMMYCILEMNHAAAFLGLHVRIGQQLS